MSLAKIVYKIRVNPTKTLILTGVVVSVFLGLFAIISIINAVVGDPTPTDIIEYYSINTKIKGSTTEALFDGQLHVVCRSVQRRPLSVFQKTTEGNPSNLAAVQVDLGLTYINTGGEAPPSTVNQLLTPGPLINPTTTIGLIGNIPGEATTLWEPITVIDDQAGRYNILEKPLPLSQSSISGSVVFAVPVNAENLSLMIIERGKGRNNGNVLNLVQLEGGS